jgi:hypothetical protein
MNLSARRGACGALLPYRATFSPQQNLEWWEERKKAEGSVEMQEEDAKEVGSSRHLRDEPGTGDGSVSLPSQLVGLP